jgi:hypothetical protein
MSGDDKDRDWSKSHRTGKTVSNDQKLEEAPLLASRELGPTHTLTSNFLPTGLWGNKFLLV